MLLQEEEEDRKKTAAGAGTTKVRAWRFYVPSLAAWWDHDTKLCHPPPRVTVHALFLLGGTRIQIELFA